MLSAKSSGGLLVATGLAVPAITYFAALKVLAIDASGGPPNQGAMVTAFFCVVGSVVVGFLLVASGAFVLFRSCRISGDRKSRDGTRT